MTEKVRGFLAECSLQRGAVGVTSQKQLGLGSWDTDGAVAFVLFGCTGQG